MTQRPYIKAALSLILSTMMILHAHAQDKESPLPPAVKATESPVKWTRNLPKPVRKAWQNCKYKDWLILDMKKIEQPDSTIYTIHVGQVQSLGPDDADIGSEYILFFSDKGQLIKEQRKY
jgi:hypothetical protein